MEHPQNLKENRHGHSQDALSGMHAVHASRLSAQDQQNIHNLNKIQITNQVKHGLKQFDMSTKK